MARDSPARSLSNPQEEALHLFCKQMLKSRLFKGFYTERCYVDSVNGYRDLIVLNRNEKDLKLILEDIQIRLQQFYQSKSPPMWVGITTTHSETPDTCIWAELDELAFDQYWFSVKSVRFRENEVIIKLKSVRAVEAEPTTPSVVRLADGLIKKDESISLQDFVQVFTGWGTGIKRTAYEFMCNDISKDNLKAILKFFTLITISLLSGSLHAIKFIGIFTIRFMTEFRKLLIAATPIFMRIIDLCGKIVGGFYILLAMIWRDATGGLKRQGNQPNAIEYNRMEYRSIKYD